MRKVLMMVSLMASGCVEPMTTQPCVDAVENETYRCVGVFQTQDEGHVSTYDVVEQTVNVTSTGYVELEVTYRGCTFTHPGTLGGLPTTGAFDSESLRWTFDATDPACAALDLDTTASNLLAPRVWRPTHIATAPAFYVEGFAIRDLGETYDAFAEGIVCAPNTP